MAALMNSAPVMVVPSDKATMTSSPLPQETLAKSPRPIAMTVRYAGLMSPVPPPSTKSQKGSNNASERGWSSSLMAASRVFSKSVIFRWVSVILMVRRPSMTRPTRTPRCFGFVAAFFGHALFAVFIDFVQRAFMGDEFGAQFPGSATGFKLLGVLVNHF